MKHLLTVLVKNKSGVLTRLTGLFSRRGYNIDSLSVSSTENPLFSRMTIVVTADELIMCQIIKQLQKLEDVVKVKELEYENSVVCELLMLKVKVSDATRKNIEIICDGVKAEIVDLCNNSVIIKLTDSTCAIDSFIEKLKGYSIIELSRTGQNALERGKEKLA